MVRWGRISGLSAYPRLNEEIRKQTYHGAAVTLLGICLAVTLFSHELAHFLQVSRREEMNVDLSRGERLRIFVNMIFPALACAAVNLDTLDLSGTVESDTRFAKHLEVHKVRLDANGRRIDGREYHSQEAGSHEDMYLFEAMKHIKEIDDETERHEGCNIFGYIDAHKISGTFHFSIHIENFILMSETHKEIEKAIRQRLKHIDENESQTIEVEHDLSRINVSHVIHKMAFGPDFPGQQNPLDGFKRAVHKDSGTFKYFLKIVPTRYSRLDGSELRTNQYSVTEYFRPSSGDDSALPAVQFLYDFSPIVVDIAEVQRSLQHFAVRLCAVIGGVIAVTGFLGGWVNWIFSEALPLIRGELASPRAHLNAKSFQFQGTTKWQLAEMRI